MIKFDHKVELLLDFSDELKELKSELLSVETSYQEVTFDKLQARCQKKGKDFFDKFPCEKFSISLYSEWGRRVFKQSENKSFKILR